MSTLYGKFILQQPDSSSGFFLYIQLLLLFNYKFKSPMQEKRFFMYAKILLLQ